MTLASGTTSRSRPSRFGAEATLRKLTPVMLPPGLLRLATRPVATGSAPMWKTIGMDDVAAFAASAGGTEPLVTMTATLRATNSAANAGNRSV